MNHKGCSEDQCIATSFFNGLLNPLHRTANCECHKVGPSMANIVEIIRDGGIPLIQMDQDSARQITLKVVRCASHTRSIALSHVCK